MSLVTAPAEEPLSRAEAFAQIRGAGEREEGLVDDLISAAREYAETYTGRALVEQTWDFTFDQLASGLVVPKGPVMSIVSVTYLDLAGVQQTLSDQAYRVVKRETGDVVILPALGTTWPSVARAEGSVTVRAKVGYGGKDSVPRQIKQAMKLLIAHWYTNRSAVRVGNTVAEVPLGVEALLFPFRVLY